jgi:hypothetical protein
VVADQLAAALTAGARLVFTPDPERPVFACPAEGPARALLFPMLAGNTRREVHQLLRRAVAYRQVLWRIFEGNAAGISESDARALLDGERRLVDELSVPLADALRRQVGRDWANSTGFCPRCGGVQHEKGDG